MWAFTITSKQTFVLWGKQEFLLKELRRLFGASVSVVSHSWKITGSWLFELWVWGSKFTSYTHSYFWRGDESIHRRGERPECRRASFLFYIWPSKLSCSPKTIHQMIEFPTNRGNVALLGDFWWHCWMWKPTVMQSRGNLWGKLLIQVSSETFKEKKMNLML